MLRHFHALQNGPFDLLVIGGGIYGAWTAYDAALRGLKVALVEKNDWGSGTSQSSSKLIHGGLRYLEHGWLGLVRKSLSERKRLLTLAPHRIHPLRFLLPVYEDSRVSRLTLKVGLSLYDMLGGSDSGVPKHRSVSKEEISKALPFLSGKNLLGGFEFFDAQTDDARCTLELVWGALRANAAAVNHCEVTRLLRSKNQVCGAFVQDEETGKTIEVQAKVTVNTAGPWCESLLKGEENGDKNIRLTKGVHLVMPKLTGERALILTTQKDRRVFFLLPWYGATLLGTTDTDYHGNQNEVRVEREDIAYLLREANRYLVSAWSEKDIRASFAGLRALKHIPGKTPSSVSREWVLEEPEKNLLLSVGGKFTSARIDAAQIVDRALGILELPSQKHPTEEIPFPWCPEENFTSWKKEKIQKGVSLGLDADTAENLCKRFGATVDQLLALIRADASLAKRILPEHPFCLAEVKHAVLHEMARTAEDVLRRRLPLSILTSLDPKVLETTSALLSSTLSELGTPP